MHISLKNESSNNVTSFNKPDWLTPHQHNTLFDLAKKLPLFEKVVKKLSTSKTLFDEFHRRELDITRIGKLSEVPDDFAPLLSALVTMVLRPDRLYFALRNWALSSQSTDAESRSIEFQDAFDMMTTFDAMRPILILKDSENSGVGSSSDDGESYLSVLKKFAHVSFYNSLHTFLVKIKQQVLKSIYFAGKYPFLYKVRVRVTKKIVFTCEVVIANFCSMTN